MLSRQKGKHMNPIQLATIEEAKDIAAKLGTIGGGVVDIYVPRMLGPYALPDTGTSKWYHFKFRNGAEGINVGLVRGTMQMFPSRWPMMMAIDVSHTVNFNPPETF